MKRRTVLGGLASFFASAFASVSNITIGASAFSLSTVYPDSTTGGWDLTTDITELRHFEDTTTFKPELGVMPYTVETPDGDIFCTVTEPDDGIGIKGTKFICHGRGECSELYDDHIAELKAAGYRVVTWDLPDHGRSYRLGSSEKQTTTLPDVETYTRAMRHVMAAVKDRFQGIDKFEIIAHSTGAPVARDLIVRLGAEAKNYISGLKEISPLVGVILPYDLSQFGGAATRRIATVLAPLTSFFAKALESDQADETVEDNAKTLGSLQFVIKKNTLYSHFPELECGPADGHWLFTIQKLLERVDSRSFSKAFAVSGIPHRILCAMNDLIVDKNDTIQNQQRLKVAGANSELVRVEGVGHAFHHNYHDFYPQFLRFMTDPILIKVPEVAPRPTP